MINSRDKGCRGERDFAKFLRSHGIEARRGQQHSGSPDSPDVISSLTNFHFEVKNVKKLNLTAMMRQAEADCGDKIPVGIWRQPYREWWAFVNIECLTSMVRLGRWSAFEVAGRRSLEGSADAIRDHGTMPSEIAFTVRRNKYAMLPARHFVSLAKKVNGALHETV